MIVIFDVILDVMNVYSHCNHVGEHTINVIKLHFHVGVHTINVHSFQSSF